MRYIPHTKEEMQEMLLSIGVSSTEDLFKSIPKHLKFNKALRLPAPLTEDLLLRELADIAAKNTSQNTYPSFMGAGCYRHEIPKAVSYLISKGEWVTPYTPYQPEISQGTLQAMFEYQSMICMLTSMDVANASHYDGATALAEAAMMAFSITKRKKLVVSSGLHPEYREVLKTITAPKEMEILELPYTSGDGRTNITLLNEAVDETSSALIVQSPNFFGAIEEVDRCAEVAHSKGALLIVTITEPIALGILEPPGRLGADIVVGEGMSFGSPTNFGGPCLGIFAAREKFLRQMPGRICGMTKDMDGKRGFVLTISTREQHIRREKATSNICSNETLLATRAAMYLSLIGKEGLREIAIRNYSNAEYLKERLSKIKGIRIPFSAPTFNEFVIETELDGDELLNRMLKHKVFGGVALGRWYKEMKKAILVASTECHTKRELDEYVRIVSKCIEG